LVDRFAEIIKSSPRLQSHPGGPSFAHACPAWVEDDALDAEHHLRTAAIRRPGSLRQLLDLVSVFESFPFDPDRAPWDGTLIEGLEGDRAALIDELRAQREQHARDAEAALAGADDEALRDEIVPGIRDPFKNTPVE